MINPNLLVRLQSDNHESILRQAIRKSKGLPNDNKSTFMVDYASNHKSQALMQFSTLTGKAIYPCEEFIFDGFISAKADGILDGEYIVLVRVNYHERDKEEFAPLKEHEIAKAQLTMFVTGYKKCVYILWGYKHIQDIIIEYDENFINDKLDSYREFYNLYLSEYDNPRHEMPLLREIHNKPAIAKLERLDAIKAEEELLKAERDEIMEYLIELSGGESCVINGRKFTLIEKQGSISYASAIKSLDTDIDLEQFRGKPSSFWKLS